MVKKCLVLCLMFLWSAVILIPAETIGQAKYVGAEKCAMCHKAYYDNWKATGHPNKLRTAKEAKEAGVPKPDYVSWDDILLVIGGFKWKARYVGQDGFIITQSPDGKIQGKNQFNIESEQFTNYNEGKKAPYDCGECHTTGYKKEGNQMGKPGLIGTWAFNGIQCEACHGPGGDHAAKPSKANIKIDRSAKFCATCHRRGYDMNVIPAKGSGFIDHREQYQELLQSPHKGMNCVDCHNPHKRARLDMKTTCATCHDKQIADFKDSKHQKAKVNCTECHLPDLGETAVRRGYMRGDLSTHLFKINIDPNAKQLTDDKKFSQGYITLAFACLNCHADRNVSWAAQYAKGIHKLGK